MNFVKVLIPMYLRGSVHNEVRIKPGNTKGIENLAQYIIRNTFSLAKLSYVESTGTVIYRSKMGHGTNKKNFQAFNALEFIAAIPSHIPDRYAQMARYVGWYSNRMCGDRRKAEQEAQIEQYDDGWPDYEEPFVDVQKL